MAEFKSGFVTLIGRTNVGKSTLLTMLVGEKVAAIANKVQTTRTAIRGIVNRENFQIIFIDKLVINPIHQISEKHHKKLLHLIDLQEYQGEHGIGNQRERRSHLPTSYGPVGLW